MDNENSGEALMRETETEANEESFKSMSTSIEQLVEQGKSQTELLKVLVWDNRLRESARLAQFVQMTTLAVLGGNVALVGILLAVSIAVLPSATGWPRMLIGAFVGLLVTYLLYAIRRYDISERAIHEMLETCRNDLETWPGELGIWPEEFWQDLSEKS